MDADWLIENIQIATLDESVANAYGIVNDGIVAVQDDRIVWAGAKVEAPNFTKAEVIDGRSRWLTPGLIDCHTHLIYGGNRAKEFEARLQGCSYEQIARQGGGILSTVAATRQASKRSLFDSAAKRLNALLREGVTTLEIKSGYGLDLDTEIKMLTVARQLADSFPVTIQTTFLGAHALPGEYRDRADDYIDLVCNTMLPAIAERGLADAVDVFCESIGFSAQQCRRVFDCARQLKLPVKGHVEQLSYLGGAKLVAEFKGLSADHLEYLPVDAIDALQSVVPVILPCAFYYLNETQKPPIDAMRQAQLPMALATDVNPGSSPSASLLLVMNQACILFGFTPEEALAGTTRNAAKALGLGAHKGQIKAGFDADLLLWDIDHPSELSYAINMHHPCAKWVGGKRV